MAVVALTAAVAAVIAEPASRSDYARDHGVHTVYPLTALPLIALLAGAAVTVVCRPSVAREAAVICALVGSQVAGIAAVASRDWLNVAGANGSSPERGAAGSRLAAAMLVIAVGVVAVSLVLYLSGPRRHDDLMAYPGSILTGSTVAVALPMLLCLLVSHPSLTAAGQFALWWSLPWGSGIIAAGTLPTRAGRRVAAGTVALSVALTLTCAAVYPVYGFGLRLPD
ncbi:hypothetical protein [Actinoplanes sp. NPDC051494]|uniref:hypothetical protein n=1 Tax=Actinoplanes sp. NPDC051494 TaxID=3363907 RepID=UPI0037A01B92